MRFSRHLSSLLGRSPRPDRIWTSVEELGDDCDVAVVGGGVRALAVALACAAEGARVALLAGGEIAAAADERAWPVLRAAQPERLRAATDAGSIQRFRKLARGFDEPVGAEAAGCLAIATSHAEVEDLTEAASALKAQSVQAWMVPAREVAALSPPIAGARGVEAALYEPEALTLDADALALALAEAAGGMGAALVAGCAVSSIERDGASATGLRLDGRLLRADAIVLADDTAAIRLIREGKGRLSLTRDERVTLVTAADAPAIGPALAVGDLVVSRDRAGALTVSGPLGADALARRLTRLAPALSGLGVAAEEPVTVWTGVDGLPQVGPADIAGLWLALGFGRDALSLALPAADHLAAAIAGRRGSAAFAPFAPTRRPGVRATQAAR